MNNHMGMNGMNVNGMMPGMNGANGGMPMMNHGANGAGGSRTGDQERDDEYERRLNTYIYEYFIHHEQWDCAEALLKSNLTVTTKDKASPSRRRDMNGDSSMEMDSKDNLDTKRVMRSLPAPDVPSAYDNSSFLFEWFSLFWDMFYAQRKDGKATAQAMQYVQHTQQQQRMRQDPRFLQNPGMIAAGMPFPHMVRLPQGGMPMNPNDLRARAAQQNNNIRNVYVQPTPQQIMARNQMMQHQQAMQRDGSDADINGNQRPRTPSSGDNAPSPSKRPRLDPQFNGQVMLNGRPNQGMPGQIITAANAAQANSLLMQAGIDPHYLSSTQLESFQAQNTQVQKKSIQVYAQNMAAQHQQRMPQPGMPNQGSPMMPAGMDPNMGELYNNGRMLAGMPNSNGTSNHALQDYQMQLMLLEQQNKKRLLMARQEQDNNNMRPDGQPTQNGMFPNMSPQGSRSGPSPNPNDQAKRGTPKMGQPGVPGSPLPDGSMSQARGSPAVMNTFGQMPEMYQQTLKMGEGMGNPLGPNGNVVRSGPPFNNAAFNPQMEVMGRAQVAQNARGPNAAWQQGQQGQTAMMPQQPPQAQTPQMGTPLTRAMPPPSAVPATNTATGRPSSPAPTANPPTPSQQNKANPKPKKEGEKNRKKPAKKASVPNVAPSETENQAATPAPSTPVTPHPASFKDKNNNNQNQPSNLQAPTAIPPASNPIPPPQPDMNGVPFPMDSMDPNIDMTFSHGLDTGDVLDHFDFDSFLQENGDHELTFDASMAFGTFDGVEASAGDA